MENDKEIELKRLEVIFQKMNALQKKLDNLKIPQPLPHFFLANEGENVFAVLAEVRKSMKDAKVTLENREAALVAIMNSGLVYDNLMEFLYSYIDEEGLLD